MKIALLGTRGVPASYSGFETCVEQLGKRLAGRGHSVTVYCRSHHITFDGDFYKGMRLVKLPTLANKYLDTIIHSLISSFHALFRRYDVGLYFIAANSPVTWIPRIVGTSTVLNVDGLDWKREKWPRAAKNYIRFAEYLATRLPTRLLTDSRVVQDYYFQKYKIKPAYIPYGSEIEYIAPGKTLDKFNLEPKRYVLFVGRLVPENCVHHLIEAFANIETDLKCVIVGDAPYAKEYISYLKEIAKRDPRVVLTGYLFGEGYHELGTNALIFAETSGVGGTHPALVEAMAFGSCVIVHDTQENIETIGDVGFVYDGKIGASSLREILQYVLSDSEVIYQYGRRAQERAKENYSWESVTDSYESLFYQIRDIPLPTRLTKSLVN